MAERRVQSSLDAFVSSQYIGHKVLTFLFLGCELVMTKEGRGSACVWVQAAKSCSSSAHASQPVLLLSMTTGQLNRPSRADVKGQGFGHQIIIATKIASPFHPFLPTCFCWISTHKCPFFYFLGWEAKPTCISWNIWQSLAAAHWLWRPNTGL